MTTNHVTSSVTTTTGTTIHIPQDAGRQLVADVSGPEDGPAVVFCHPAPGSRRFDPDPAVTARAGVRLVTVDRPGYGATSPLPPGTVPTIPAYADDIATVCDHLGLDQVTVIGWSAGGRVAASFAERHPDRTRSLALVGTPAPDEIVGWVPLEHRRMLEGFRPDPTAAVPALTEIFEGVIADPEQRVGLVVGGDADDAVLAADPALRARVQGMLDEAFVAGPVGMALDIVSYTLIPWGLDRGRITVPTRCLYGGADELITEEHGRWWADGIPSASLTVVPGAGHLVIADVWADLLSPLASELG